MCHTLQILTLIHFCVNVTIVRQRIGENMEIFKCKRCGKETIKNEAYKIILERKNKSNEMFDEKKAKDICLYCKYQEK